MRLSAVLALLPIRAIAGADLGEIGAPIDLTIAYQSYYTEAWSGIVLRDQRFYEKYLPRGSSVRWELGLHGPVVLNALRQGRAQLGYLGDQPSVAAAAHPEIRDLRIIASTGLSADLCNVLMVRADAPALPDATAVFAWLNGKRIAASFFGCTDRFAHEIFKLGKVTPGTYLNLTPSVVKNGFASGAIDAAVVQEPIATLIEAQHLARRVLSGTDFGLQSGSFLIASAALIEQRPDIVKAWLSAELDAERYIAAPENLDAVIGAAARQTVGYEPQILRASLVADPGDRIRLSSPFVISDPARKLIARSFETLAESGRASGPALRPEAIMDGPAREILRLHAKSDGQP